MGDRLDRRLRRTQLLVGSFFVLSAAAGVYLLLPDGSLWRLAVSHAYGLIAMCAVSLLMGGVCFLGVRRLYTLAPMWAAGVIVLQLGDLVTAPAYNMSISYFASYLFGLPAYDLLLVSQFLVIVLYLRGPRLKVRARKGAYFEVTSQRQRRDFIRIMGSIGAFFVLTVVLAAIDLTGSQSKGSTSGSTTQSGSQSTSSSGSGGGSSTAPVANLSELQVGTPFTFYYPDQNHPNALFKLSDGTVEAYSLLCTHVCCPVGYNSTSQTFVCPCHGSVFDSGGRILRGPAAYALPKIALQVDSSGAITPTGVSGASPCM